MKQIIIFLILVLSLIHIVNGQITVNMDTNKLVNYSANNYTFASIDGDITETGKIIKYYDGHYVTNVKGQVIIENNGEYDLYSVNIPLKRNNNLYLIETTNTGYLYNTSIHVPILQAHESVTIGYQYIGLTLTKPHDEEGNILHTAIKKDDVRMYSDIQMNLKKGPLENQSGDWRRLVTVNIRNPSNFLIQAINIQLIKTEPGNMDLNNHSRIWKFKDTLLLPRTMMVGDILDYTDQYSEIYWISADTSVASYNLTPTNNINYYTEDDISNQDEQEIVDEIISQQSPQLEMPFDEQILVKKFLSETQIKYNETITVKNLIYNFDDTTIKTVVLKDIIPENFELIEVLTDEDRSPLEVNDKNLSWTNIAINPNSARIFTYTMKLVNPNATGVQYIDGSKVEFYGGSIKSANIPVILQFIPQKKLFLQKKVSIINDEEFLIEIEIKNLGGTPVENLVLKETVDEEKLFSEITKPFMKRGVWEIMKINSEDSWIVSFTTNDPEIVQSIPLVFGLPQDSIYTTLTVDNQIKTEVVNKIQTSEKIGISILLITIILYIVIFRRKK
ncbi:hypothetical protein JXM83_07265 [Candidatus Woesearchaeota archaeon]|nr:hypothetical protein [Candidatus Woesearchaeota archaeon]